jgi:hypothetical protein
MNKRPKKYQFYIMKRSVLAIGLLLLGTILFSRQVVAGDDSITWKKLIKKGYSIFFTANDEIEAKRSDIYIQSGINYVASFFDNSFHDTFNVYIFPDRSSLDKQWKKDWNDPAFRSECWMVASGVAYRLDILSSNAWAKEACDHNANDTTETRKVIWHELVHVFHGQYNPDHTFSYIEKLDWLVEGVATFVSGQLDNKRLQRVKQMVIDKKIPASLDDFWKGQDRYGLSGSMAAYIDKKYGRQKLFGLLKQVNKEAVLRALNISEDQLLSDWINSFQ